MVSAPIIADTGLRYCIVCQAAGVSSIFSLNQVIELDLGFAATLVNSKSPLASTD